MANKRNLIPPQSESNRIKVFIGSSSEAEELADLLSTSLEDVCDATVWDNAFEPSKEMISNLEKALDSAQYAIFLMTPDDTIKSRNTIKAAIRDNIIFEVGLSIGRIGLERTFLVSEKNAKVHFPSDITNIHRITYVKTDDLSIAMKNVATKLIRHIKRYNISAPVSSRNLYLYLQIMINRMRTKEKVIDEAILSQLQASGLISAKELMQLVSLLNEFDD